MITVYCISHVPARLLLSIPGYAGENPLLMFYLILVVQMSDVLQYVFGKLFGKAVSRAELGLVDMTDLAEIVVFLASPAASKMTGQALSVTGGISAL